MNIKHQVIFGFSFLIIFSQCNPKPVEESNTAIVSGKITNPKGTIINIRINGETITDSLDAENKFSTEFNISKPQEVIFEHGAEIATIYLKPGFNLNLNLDTDAFDETLVYTGTGEQINNFKASIVLMEDTLTHVNQLSALPEDSFLIALKAQYALKAKMIQQSDVKDKDYIDFFAQNIKWKYVYDLTAYESNHQYILKEDFEVSEDYYTFQDTLDFNNACNLEYNYFFPVIQSIITRKVRAGFANGGPKSVNEYIAASVRMYDTYENDTIKEKLYFEAINRFFNRIPEEMMDTVIRDWKKINPPTEHITLIEEKFAQWELIKGGMPAPDFKYVSINGDSLSMADFLGKVVYIDVWATWCGPCIAEHPHMEKLQEAFEDKAVAFVAVSIDNSTEPWEKMVEKKQLGGIHLYADGAWKSDIISEYMINGIPRFILIDQKGKIVNADAARPSGNIAEEIEKLL